MAEKYCRKFQTPKWAADDRRICDSIDSNVTYVTFVYNVMKETKNSITDNLKMNELKIGFKSEI